MKSIKLTMVLMLIAGIALAQQGKMAERISDKVESLNEVVQLTDEQKIEVTVILEEGSLKMRELRKSESASKETMQAERKALKQKVNEVLSEDQLVKLEAHKEAQKAARKTAKAEINEYRKQNVKPVVKAERVAFEKLLSEEEKETIEAARAMKPKRDGNKKGSMTKEDREQRKESMTQIKLLLDPIVENHKTELAKVEERLKPVKQEAKTHAENTLSANGIEKRKRKKNKTPKENGSYKFLLMKA